MVCYDFFFFKQKTAYEMRISDWSSDVCSSDLPRQRRDLARMVHADFKNAEFRFDRHTSERERHTPEIVIGERRSMCRPLLGQDHAQRFFCTGLTDAEIGRASCRERVCKYV